MASPAPLPPQEPVSERLWRQLSHSVRLDQLDPHPVQWLSPGRLAAGKLTILDGDPGLGKSTLLCELAARITRGEALPGGQPAPPRRVLLLSAEDDLVDTIRPRIDAAGGDPRRILALRAYPNGTAAGRPFVIPGDVPLFEGLVQHLEPALLIIDPLVAYLDRAHNANSDQAVRRALAALTALGASTGVAIVAVRHLNKTANANPLYRGGGSIGIIGAARCGLLLARDPDDPHRRLLAATKSNLGAPPSTLAFRLQPDAHTGAVRVVWDGESSWTADRLLQETAASPEERSVLAEVRGWLRQALAGGPRPAGELQVEARARGFAFQTYRAARRAEGVTTRKAPGLNAPWLLSLPPESPSGGDGVMG